MKTPAEEIGLQRIRSLRIRHSGKNQADLLIRFGQAAENARIDCLRFSTTAHGTGGVEHPIRIASKGVRRWFDLDKEAFQALAQAMAAIESNPKRPMSS